MINNISNIQNNDNNDNSVSHSTCKMMPMMMIIISLMAESLIKIMRLDVDASYGDGGLAKMLMMTRQKWKNIFYSKHSVQ